MNYWLMKSEPDTFSIDDLARAKKQTTIWDGVRNYQVRNMLRDQIKKNDLAFFYHSSCEVPGIAGIVKIVRTGLADPSAFNPESPYYDPLSTKENIRWYTVEVKLVKKLKRIISLKELRENHKLKNLLLLKKGMRLSIIPLTKQQWEIILKTE